LSSSFGLNLKSPRILLTHKESLLFRSAKYHDWLEEARKVIYESRFAHERLLGMYTFRHAELDSASCSSKPVIITRFYQPGLPNVVFCLKPALISHILLFPAYSLQCFLSKRLFPAKRALRPGMIFASPASTDGSQCIASRHDLCRHCVH
jgi:hypothetical protein